MEKLEFAGEQLASLYSFGCLELKQLRQTGAEELIFNFINNPEKKQIPFVKTILEKLEPFVYYRLIGKMNDINNPFDFKVVKAYWLGNDLLRPIKREDFENILSNQQVKLLDLINAKLHHNFTALWVLKKTKKIPIEKIDECIIKPGRVIEVKEESILVETKKLSLKEEKICPQDFKQEISSEFLKGCVSINDWVSIHFGIARQKISQEAAENLYKITEEAILFYRE